MPALYSFLRTSEIRLLSVHRKHDGSLAGTLKTLSIEGKKSIYEREEKKLDYFAVSYVWGSRDHDQTIEVDGQPLTITLNAHTVLSLFCDWPQQRNREARIWIDAVCINQEDALEKSIQVPLMAQIYGRAKRAVVWLGESSVSTDQGMELMRTLAMGTKGYPVPQSVIKSSTAWAGFEEIASRPWWRRAWTLQESVIPSDTVYYCGAKSLTADEVRSAVLVVSSYQYTNSEDQLSKATWAPLWHRRRIYQWLGHQDMDDDFDGYERRRPTGDRKLGQISLPALLAYQRHSSSTNPKDYLYSLLGCIKDKDKQLIGPPAYDSSTEEVYREFVRSWVLAYQSLDIIAFTELFPRPISSQQTTDRLPSWVPDWSARLEFQSEESNAVPLLVSQPNKPDIGSMLPPRFLRRSAEEDYYGSRESLPVYDAAGNMAMRVFFSKDLTRLQCTGIIIDTIDGISGTAGDKPQPVEPSTSPTNLTNNGAALEHTEVATHIIQSLYFGRADVYLQYEADERVFVEEADYCLREPVQGRDAEYAAWIKQNSDVRIRGVSMYDAINYREVVQKEIFARTKAEKTARKINEQAASERSGSGSPRRRRSSIPSDASNDSNQRNELDEDEYLPPRRRSSPRRSFQARSSSTTSSSSTKTKEDEESTRHDLNRKFRTATHQHWMARRLAVTEKGHVGMVTKNARKGDVVCVLFGCSVPMVLRNIGKGEYEVVGECYLEGFMEGQALKEERYEAVDLTLV
ncbi:Heterokaryon incompatibility protein 6, OR allele [Fulvia fulva]|uniref:Heterokaryon incompatibility protein 6, OR allele n=1 Tax=Passalora fulva TaxID=5499 RepID=A0A9Q8UVG8_PASFU|nr:Heterokaryon incompatibility protein 6, OR allele [Fulvia fulva]KAK4611769.1 Heterokaryon incompatibility protein 6, OR allele [Fulvia fulva]UJO23862.1 Heterokaryon incompatibility protein 6, OR allele [Fulvia fulva]WPV21177.1 Heterokaryon incompatibility protein 6, OR allele [Fulvia fulva]WPV36076.1 Heterokaryon incompatibility protein 6, OR allele [Fulvia fulva]